MRAPMLLMKFQPQCRQGHHCPLHHSQCCDELASIFILSRTVFSSAIWSHGSLQTRPCKAIPQCMSFAKLHWVVVDLPPAQMHKVPPWDLPCLMEFGSWG